MNRADNSTLFIELESGDYPLYLRDIRARHPNTMFPSQPTEAVMLEEGYAMVERVSRPIDPMLVVTQGPAVNENGVWKESWVTRELTSEELSNYTEQKRSELKQKIHNLYLERIRQGVLFDLGEERGEVILAIDEESNIFTMAEFNIASHNKGEGVEDYTTYYRTKDEQIVELTADEMITVGIAVYQAVKDLRTLIWSLEKTLANATTLEEFPEVPES